MRTARMLPAYFIQLLSIRLQQTLATPKQYDDGIVKAITFQYYFCQHDFYISVAVKFDGNPERTC